MAAGGVARDDDGDDRLVGRWAGMSHVFYTRGEKCFFAKVLTDADAMVVVAFPLPYKRFHFLQTEQTDFVGRRCSVSKVKPFRVFGDVDDAEKEGGGAMTTVPRLCRAVRVSSRSQVEFLSPPPTSDAAAAVVTGVITRDEHADSGVYALNRRVTLVATLLCHVTNVPRLQRGQKVAVAGARWAAAAEGNAPGRRCLVMGAQSFVQVRDEAPENVRLHRKCDTEQFGQDTVVDLTLKFNLNFVSILDLLDLRQAMEKKLALLPDQKADNCQLRALEVHGRTEANPLELVLSQLLAGKDLRPLNERSLVKEFYADVDSCTSMKTTPELRTLLARLQTVKELRGRLKVAIGRGRRQRRERAEREEAYRKTTTTTKQRQATYAHEHYCLDEDDETASWKECHLLGTTTWNDDWGMSEIRDETDSIPVCFLAAGKKSCESFFGRLVRVRKFRPVYESVALPVPSCSYGGGGSDDDDDVGRVWECSYLVVDPDDVDVVDVGQDTSKTCAVEEEEKDSANSSATSSTIYTVVNAGSAHLLSSSSSSSWHVLACVRRHGCNSICYTRLELSESSRLNAIRLGTRLTGLGGGQPQETFCYQLKRGLGGEDCKLLRFAKGVSLLDTNNSSCASLAAEQSFDLSSLESIPFGELVSIRGVVVQRWLELDKFERNGVVSAASSSSSSAASADTATTARPRVPPKTVLHVKLKSIVTPSSSSSSVSCYVSHWSSHAYPLGLLPNSPVRLDNVLKAESSLKRNVYFKSSPLTTFHLLRGGDKLSLRRQVSLLMDVKLRQEELEEEAEEAGFQPGEELLCQFSVEVVRRVSLRPHCGACGNPMAKGFCTFAGCHGGGAVGGGTKIVCRGDFVVQDATASAGLYVQDPEMLRKLLSLPESQWAELVAHVKRGNELAYFFGAKTDASSCPVEDCFRIYCDVFFQTNLVVVTSRCRPFRRSGGGGAASAAASETDDLKLFCIDVE